MHTIVTRPATTDELATLKGRTGFAALDYGCFAIFLGAIALIAGSFGTQVFANFFGTAHSYWIGGLCAVALFIRMMMMAGPTLRRHRQRALKDVQAQLIQDLHVVNPRVVELNALTDNEPILVFQIGDDSILYLQGQWLRDPATYKAPDLDNDPFEEFVNGLPEPHSFPSTEFTISRFPNCGAVTWIRVQGPYLAPESTIDADKMGLEFEESELFQGSLSDIAEILEREHQRRVPNSKHR